MIEIRELRTRADQTAFIRLPGQILRNDPCWVEPLLFERRAVMTPKTNPVFEHADVRFWLACRNGRPVGRISAQVDRLAAKVDGKTVGFFGMLAAEDDGETVKALFDQAEGWLQEKGCAIVRGPFSLSINQESGILIDGFDTPPNLLMPHDPPWLGGRVEEQGYHTGANLLAYEMPLGPSALDPTRKVAARKVPGQVIRSLDMSRYQEEMRMLCRIFNDAWVDNWGFVPMTQAEADAMAHEIRPIVDPKMVQIAEQDGRGVGFIIFLPNINEALHDLDGRLFPFGWAKLIWRLKVKSPKTARVPLMGVETATRDTFAGKMLPYKLIHALEPRGLVRGFKTLELSWILETNKAVRTVIESLSGKVIKTYRVYEKDLA